MKKLLLSLAVFFGLALSAFGQTALTATTLSGAVNASQTFITLGSVTGISVNTVLFIEDGNSGIRQGAEAMQVVAVPSTGTTVQVLRGYDQTIPTAHLTLVPVLAGPANAFNEYDPTGACTAANTQYTPYINLKTGNQWLCSPISNSWVPGFFNIDGYAGVTAAVASVAGATNPSGPLFHVTGTNAITAWGSSTSVGLFGGAGSATSTVGAPFCVIPDAIFTTTATNNIALASTAVVNKILCFTFDQTNKKYVPTY
jgi:hypothetical protein